MKKKFNITLPEYLTVDMFKKIVTHEGTEVSKLVNTVAAMVGLDNKAVKEYPVDLLRQVSQDLEELALPKEQFNTLVEFNGTLYGYSNIHNMNLGCFVDMEEYCKDTNNNLEKIAALLYRPVVSNRFNGLKYQVKQGIRVGFEKGIENPFDYYDVETYDSDVCKERWEEMKDFPSHILLGGLSFFLAAASLYLTNTAFLDNTMSERTKKNLDKMILTGVSPLIGDGGQPFTGYQNPVYYQSPGISV